MRTSHEFFGEVCDALEGISEILATGPKLGLADDRRETPIVDSQSQVDLRNKLADKAALTHFGVKTADELSARHNLRLAAHSLHSGVASNHGRVGYVADPKLLDQQGLWLRDGTHPNKVVGTKLHEDLHQMFTRVGERYGAGGRKRLAADLISTLPEDERKAAQDFRLSVSMRVRALLGQWGAASRWHLGLPPQKGCVLMQMASSASGRPHQHGS